MPCPRSVSFGSLPDDASSDTPQLENVFVELRALRENQGTLLRQVEEWMSQQGLATMEILAKQKHVEDTLKQVFCRGEAQEIQETPTNSCARITFNDCSSKTGGNSSTQSDRRKTSPLPTLLRPEQIKATLGRLKHGNEESPSDASQASCSRDGEPSRLSSMNSMNSLSSVENSGSESDSRSHWRQMIRQGRNSSSRKSSAKLGVQDPSLLHRIIRSHSYETVVLLLVLSNTVFIGWHVQYQAVHHRSHKVQPIAELGFFVAFLLELILRFCADGVDFFWSEERVWNIFDVIIVGMMMIEHLLQLTVDLSSANLSQLSSVRVFRILRVVRVVRVIRVLRFFHELRVMIHSIMGCSKFLAWAVLVMLLVFYIFGFSLTQGVINHCESSNSWQSSDSDALRQHFGTLDRSTLFLFQAMSGGINWGELLDALGPLDQAYKALFIFYITISVFAVVNIVTGIFVDYAMQSSQEDRDLLTQFELRAKEQYIKRMQGIFDEMDLDGDGFISLPEFEIAIKDERMASYFSALGLEITDLNGLFALLDRDKTGEIDTEEFVLGCMRLKGGARSLDMAKLQYESEWMVHNLEALLEVVKETVRRSRRPTRRPTNFSVAECDFASIPSSTSGHKRFPTV